MIPFNRNKVFFVRNFYLSKLEVINKFNLNDVRSVPNLSKIVINFPVSDFLKGCFNTNKNEYNLDVQIKFVMVLYLLVFNLPFINFKVLEKQVKGFRKNSDIRGFSLKTTIVGTNNVYCFLIKVLKGCNDDSILGLRKNVRIYDRNFLDVRVFLNRILSGINSQDLSLNLGLKVFNPLALKIKYLPLFS